MKVRRKGTFERLGRVVVAFHVVRKHHELGENDEAAAFRIAKADVHPVALRQNAVAVVGLLDLGEDERHAVDQKCDIRAEFIVAVLAGEFRDNAEGVAVEIFEIDEFEAGRIPVAEKLTAGSGEGREDGPERTGNARQGHDIML